jgi:MFS family permease
MSLLTKYFNAFKHFQRNARLYLINNALGDVTVGIILVLYNLYLTASGYRADFIGLVLFMGTLGAGLAIFPAGLCIDRFGGKAILIWSSVLIGLAGTGQMLLRQPVPLLISAFLAGIGAAFMLVVNAPFLIANSAPAERSLLFSLNIVVALVTTVLGELLGGFLPIWLRAWPWAMATLPYGLNSLLVSQPLARSYQLSLLIAGLIAAPSFIPLFMMSDDRPSPNSAGTALSHLPSNFTAESVKNVVCGWFFSAE